MFLLIVKPLHNNYALHKQDFQISSNYHSFKWRNALQRSRLSVLIASLIMIGNRRRHPDGSAVSLHRAGPRKQHQERKKNNQTPAQ